MTIDLAAIEALDDAALGERPFDELVAQLQRIVQALEAGSVGLEESIRLYQAGLRLHAASESRLREAELTISELGRRAGAATPTEPSTVAPDPE
jgi:exodeoxyribonuclease VII small subunit